MHQSSHYFKNDLSSSGKWQVFHRYRLVNLLSFLGFLESELKSHVIRLSFGFLLFSLFARHCQSELKLKLFFS
jgi:hypothetical protein